MARFNGEISDFDAMMERIAKWAERFDHRLDAFMKEMRAYMRGKAPAETEREEGSNQGLVFWMEKIKHWEEEEEDHILERKKTLEQEEEAAVATMAEDAWELVAEEEITFLEVQDEVQICFLGPKKLDHKKELSQVSEARNCVMKKDLKPNLPSSKPQTLTSEFQTKALASEFYSIGPIRLNSNTHPQVLKSMTITRNPCYIPITQTRNS